MPNVLLVEDEFLIRTVLVDALRDVGLACTEAPTGQAALDVVTSAEPLSAIVVDIGLPDMSGERIIEAAAQHRPGMPIVCCSGRPGPAQEIPGVTVHFYPKPYSAKELSKFIASLVAVDV